MQAAAGHGLGIGDAAHGLQHHRQVVLDRDAAAVVGVQIEQAGQRVMRGLHLATEPVDLAFEAEQRGPARRGGAQLRQQGPGARDVGRAHGQFDQHLDRVHLLGQRQRGQQLAQPHRMLAGAGDVAGEHPVVDQRGQRPAFDLAALGRVGHRGQLGQHRVQRGLAAGQVVEQVAGSQLQPGAQGLGGVQRVVGHGAPLGAGVVEAAAGLELLGAAVLPGQRGLRLAGGLPVGGDAQRVGLGLAGQPQRGMAVQGLALRGRQGVGHGLADQVVAAGQAGIAGAQQAAGHRQGAGLGPVDVAGAAGHVARRRRGAQGGGRHRLHEHRRRLHRLPHGRRLGLQAGQHQPRHPGAGRASRAVGIGVGARQAGGHQLAQQKGIAAAERMQPVEQVGVEGLRRPARGAGIGQGTT